MFSSSSLRIFSVGPFGTLSASGIGFEITNSISLITEVLIIDSTSVLNSTSIIVKVSLLKTYVPFKTSTIASILLFLSSLFKGCSSLIKSSLNF
jgi:hypothetical protein